MSEDKHDPGGKVRLKLAADIVSTADFSDCGQYRRLLSRRFPDGRGSALWIGMNPSTAGKDADDPTVRRETIYTRERLGKQVYVKANVMDYRATYPKALLEPGVIPCSEDNIPAILEAADKADIVIAAWGALKKPFAGYARAIESELILAGHTLWCVGFTKEGHPRHPLYVKKDAPFLRYRPAA